MKILKDLVKDSFVNESGMTDSDIEARMKFDDDFTEIASKVDDHIDKLKSLVAKPPSSFTATRSQIMYVEALIMDLDQIVAKLNQYRK